jgi:hypothetical protein
MARDYFGESVEGSEGRLSKALEAAVPSRLTPAATAIDHPWSYARATLEAAVAAATRSDEPYAVSSPSVAATIDELGGRRPSWLESMNLSGTWRARIGQQRKS